MLAHLHATASLWAINFFIRFLRCICLAAAILHSHSVSIVSVGDFMELEFEATQLSERRGHLTAGESGVNFIAVTTRTYIESATQKKFHHRSPAQRLRPRPHQSIHVPRNMSGESDELHRT